MTVTVSTVKELQALLADRKVGAVFTMGALHQGHASLMTKCREQIGETGLLVVTVFVNPTQFNDPKDLASYPRTLDKDVELCSKNSVDIVFAPTLEEIYPPNNPVVDIDPGHLASELEGASRPGHFKGVVTVVKRLLEITAPEVTCFGEKDYQQLVIVKQMVRRFGIKTEVIGVPTVREPDGLAMSSRNKRLNSKDRTIASKLYEALIMVRSGIMANKSISQSISDATSWLQTFPEIDLDYLTVLSPELTKPTPGLARALIAAKIGDVRLIDNLECFVGEANV